MLVGGQRRPALAALQRPASQPLKLQAKEGLALINGTQTSTALALHALFAFEPVLEAALVVGALTVDAARGSDGPFDPRIHALRGQPGQIDVARLLPRAARRAARSACRTSKGDDRVQDPYSLRCQPQVVGACLDQLRHAALVLLREANAVTDNPLVFADEGELPAMMISGGNFHAEPVALAADAHGAGHRRGRRDRRAAHRDADRRRRVAAAAVPDGRRRAEQRLHDRARHRRGAGQREQVARAPGQRRSACRPAPTRKTMSVDGHLRRAPPAADDRATPRTSSASNCWPRRRASSSCARCRVRPRWRRRMRCCAQPCRRWRTTATSRPTSTRATALVSDGSLARILQSLPALPALVHAG